MKRIMYFLTLTLLMLLPCVGVTAQEVGIPEFTTPADIFGSMEVIYGALIVVGGYLSHLIPGLNKVSNNAYRVLAFALVSAVAFATFGANVVGLVLTYAATTSIYEIILKWILPTNKVKTATNGET